jgi:hypothetical protein
MRHCLTILRHTFHALDECTLLTSSGDAPKLACPCWQQRVWRAHLTLTSATLPILTTTRSGCAPRWHK